MEVMISVAIAGLVITAGFRLVSMSIRTLSEIEGERALAAAARRVWLKFRVEGDVPDSGKDDDGTEWRTEIDSVPVEEMEMSFRRVTVTLSGRSMVIYLPYNEENKQ